MGVLAGMGDCPLAFGDNSERLCAWDGKPLAGRARRWCSRECGGAWWRSHAWSAARRVALKRDGYACVRCGSRERLEVNHKTPVMGRHSQSGCHHHPDGLETLCHPCHVRETAVQFGHKTAAAGDQPTLFADADGRVA